MFSSKLPVSEFTLIKLWIALQEVISFPQWNSTCHGQQIICASQPRAKHRGVRGWNICRNIWDAGLEVFKAGFAEFKILISIGFSFSKLSYKSSYSKVLTVLLLTRIYSVPTASLLLSIRMYILSYKGRVHLSLSLCVNEYLLPRIMIFIFFWDHWVILQLIFIQLILCNY